ncbi:hypothetical protein FYK55_24410 [Roseiconus nitratireducens]|uniref:Uncharacterized protein n=1 Tax=Roseiconus nitratireducens TaxID=2605748 RepID=A0A5M6D1G3_9BACT|nr:hypothetical protein [Roseiconus nitratireducens]KAA5539479.1 hypothetical protein FYK55_24410 [Roseiconus nitratireducens]
MVMVPLGVFALTLSQKTSSLPGSLFSPHVLFSLLAIPLFGIPGAVIACQGPICGEAAHENRRGAIKIALFLGLAAFANGMIWVTSHALFDLLIPPADDVPWDAFLSHLYAHTLICAALWMALFALLLASLLSGRNVFCISFDKHCREITEQDSAAPTDS